MATEQNARGTHSELMAATALLANGWEVAKPMGVEVYDLVAKSPDDGRWYTFQVKTARLREDKGDALVVDGKRNSGAIYTRDDCDYFIGVHENNVYVLDNRELTEYWKLPTTTNGWRELKIRGRAM